MRAAHVLVLGLGLAICPSLVPVADAAARRSAAPTSGEWARAPHLRDVPGGCVGERVREWFRLRCDDAMYGSVVLLAGSRDRVFMKVDDALHATVVMAVQKGDARVIQLNQSVFEGGYDGEGGGGEQVPGWTLSESWEDGDEDAEIVVE